GAGLALLVRVPVPVGNGARAAAPTVGIPAPPASPRIDRRDAAVQQLTAQVQAAVAAPAGVRAVPANLSPPLARMPADRPDVFVNGCMRSYREVGQPECASGDPSSTTRVALVGDSHAVMWQPALEPLAQQRHWRLE